MPDRDSSAAFERVVTARARRSYGVLTELQLLALGATDRWITQRVRCGWLVRVHRGVYRVAGVPASWESLAAAAVAALPGAALSHRSAARLLGLDAGPATSELHLLAPTGCIRPRLDGVHLHRTRSWCQEDVVCVGVLRVTSPARTIVDLSPDLTRPSLERMLDDACVRGLVAPERVRRVLTRLGTRGRPGAGALVAALRPWEAGRLDSVAEAAVERLLRRFRLPPARPQYEVRDGDGAFVARLDFAWPERRVALEVDGFRWHSSPRALHADLARQNRLQALGWSVVRTGPSPDQSERDVLRSALRRLLGPS